MTTLTVPPRAINVRPMRREAQSRSPRPSLPTLDSVKHNVVSPRCLERWENEGGARLDEHSIAYNS